MPEDLWTEVDAYIDSRVVRPDPVLERALNATAGAGMPPIAVSAAQGKLLALIARMIGARRILEIGTLGGYSTIWLAGALSAGGSLLSLEIDPAHAGVARANLAAAGLDKVAEVRVGGALDTLPTLSTEPADRFDLVFIDADKASIPEYFDWSLRLTHPGSIIVVDNVIRDGKVIDGSSDDPNVVGVRRFNDLIAATAEVSATTIQTVGSKGYDGFTLALVEG
ncbi:MAG: O-methyltransferase [Acidimicrobiales bacterium]